MEEMKVTFPDLKITLSRIIKSLIAVFLKNFFETFRNIRRHTVGLV